jgi:glutathione peroxidase
VSNLESGAHIFSFTAIDGAPLPLSAFRGKALLVVNTASRCGFTSQYERLQALWMRHRDEGLVVIGVPCNQFGGQEPGGSGDVIRFCAERYRISFPLTMKVDVRGASAHPFFAWAAEQAGFLGRPRWNFHKYLIGRDGGFRTWFSTFTNPEALRVNAAITRALA